jgi:glycosyltransferase involved in cell wall biosynthesis
MRALGAAPAFVFVVRGEPLADQLDRLRIPRRELALPRGRAVLRAPRRLGRAVSASRPDAAILIESGYLAATLRTGGYRGPIIGTEHGSLLQLHTLDPLKRLIRTADRISGLKACSVVVAVSEYMKDRVAARWPRARVVCIPNGVDLERFSPWEEAIRRTGDGGLVVGCAARLVQGKGVEDVIRALSYASLNRARLRIAGDGPRSSALKALASSAGVDARVEFLGPVVDMPAFWRGVDVAVVVSNGAVESFGMAAVEAMACGKPVVVSDSGALPYVVVHGECGQVVRAGDVAAIASAIADYADDVPRRALHGANGRERCEQEFSIERAARRYLELCARLIWEDAGRKRA